VERGKSILEVEDFVQAITMSAQTGLRESIDQRTRFDGDCAFFGSGNDGIGRDARNRGPGRSESGMIG
jgi:hypothetical protein